MKKAVIVFVAFLLLSGSALFAKSGEIYFKFRVTSPDEFQKISKVISIDNIKDGEVYAYANPEELAKFQELGYTYEQLQHPGTLIHPRMAAEKSGMKDWDAYPTYNAYVAMMNQFELDYPGLCEIVDIGNTVEGRDLLFAKISDNVSVEEDEPEVMYTATMHGDETTGYVLSLRLIDYLLSNYGTDSLATRLVDSCEIWINPLANPDGTFNSGDSTVYSAERYNANGKDLNRNYPDPDGPIWNPTGTWQIETVAFMDFAEDHSIVISANFHGGAEVCNYPWDTWSRLTPDNQWWIDVCRQYADSAHYYSPSGYLTDLNDGITNGYAWYTTSGNRQDYMNYWHGCREMTAEISGTKLLPASSLPAHWDYNKVSLMDYLEQALYGIRGVVTDYNSGLPILATITLLGHDTTIDSSRVFTDPDVGDYHRMVVSGTYTVEYSCPGYYPDTVTGVVVTDLQSTRVDVALVPLPNEPDLNFVSTDAGTIDPSDNVSMHITLENIGAGIAFNADGTLSTSDTYINITQNYSTYPNIGAMGGTEQSNSLYQFTVDPGTPLEHQAEFELAVTADGGYTEIIYFTLMIGQQKEDFESGDMLAWPWEFSGDADWEIATDQVYEGSYSGRSGTIGHSDSTRMELTGQILSGGNISFYYKVSSESGYDYLAFYIDNTKKEEWSGDVDWAQAVYAVTAGSHTFKWVYYKDGSQTGGSDRAWIDLIIFPSIQIVPEIITTTAPDWTLAELYSYQLNATGGMGTLTWDDKNGDLSGTGLSLSATGLLSGIPVAAGQISFTGRVTDQSMGTDEQVYTFDINPRPDITTASIADWTTGRSYSATLAATGGTGSKTWTDLHTELSGTGLSLSSGGLISGTPTTTGELHVTARVADQIGATDTTRYIFTINQAVLVTTTSVPEGTIDEAYSYQLESSGGTGTMTWSDKYNSLNGSGMTLSTTGLLSGTPTGTGSFGFYAVVQDATGSKSEQPLELVVAAAYVCGNANGDESVNVSDAVYIINFVFSGGNAPSPLESGDANCDTKVNVSDAVYLINYVFSGGNSPCDTDGDTIPDC